MDAWLLNRKRMNKKGQTVIFLVVALLLVVAIVGVILLIGIISTNTNSILDQNVSVGQVNLQTYNSQTFGKFNTMVANSADFWGLATIIGMILAMFIFSYSVRNRYPKFVIVIDIGVLIGAFIFSLYIRAVYSTVVTALSNAGQTFAIDSLSGTNYFILNLPIFVTVIGVVMMILFHSSIPPKVEELNLNSVPTVVASG